MTISETLIDISADAGEAILNYYKDEIKVETKDDESPLTKADLASHHVIVDALRKLTPETPVISEESGLPKYEERKEWKKYWLVDPLDGTKEFIKKNGEFTVNIALIENNKPVIGVVHIPAKKITYIGQKSLGSYKIDSDGNKTEVISTIPGKNKKVSIVTSRSHGSSDTEDRIEKMGFIVGKSVPAGSSLKFCLVAEGTADIYPRFGPTMEWDTAAGDAVFRYSGKDGERYSPLEYNKPSMKNGEFVIGHK
ncbi:3'(2'),5'-bisphosphate nucleotidase CysQ [Rhodohalobacter sulfatireducens]|uniref:3'(2'),5'-bisphosphate nucleotidase CysQ n=1 Tax=Rhodohalobacter sulfatireducens TaxID=2911366 RepID=A0ABS9KJ01_9BACT|nr:3'(2'),5'-bisphosphate nucleotidase CysQ [Rhodohalobacter sulfatireducens]MCG2590820.1 3'(2'),5'-bisphosphate nucleotidase CysQ [Rhodohalobacter sulfatireducens]